MNPVLFRTLIINDPSTSYSSYLLAWSLAPAEEYTTWTTTESGETSVLKKACGRKKNRVCADKKRNGWIS
ncbi:unnamed protein product [Allacma fusca]|uniref:Uncharacterized protein n=1 Tax=Allacma fusca TaxID=39272 RepID=A0A8J2JJD6_9HEXA|nr:unnamed protein product [Allacma fusca]